MSNLDSILTRVRRLLETKQPVLVAIDGYGGAGKTTLAKRIQSEFENASIISLDDFATDTESGADRTRFLAHVLEPLSRNEAARYQPFSWKHRALLDWVEVAPQSLIIIEGVSVIAKDFYPYYDLRIWIDCPFELAQARMQERERKAGRQFSLSNWFNVWEKEDRDYGLTEPWLRADIILSMS